MTATASDVYLDFPWTCVVVRDECVSIVLPRERLQEVENFLAALRLGLAEAEVPPAGRG
jgi:hypothetical protein